jgi:hypothetical protein
MTSTTPPELKTPQKTTGVPSWLLGLGGAAIVGGFGLLGYWLQTGGGGPQTRANALAFVPQDAIGAVTLTTDGDAWQLLRQTGNTGFRIGLGQWLALGRDRISGLGYGNLQDLQGYLAGPPTIAMIASPNGGANGAGGVSPFGQVPDLLMIVPVKNPGQVKAWLAQRPAPAGVQNPAMVHRGQPIWDIQANLGARHNATLLNGHVLIANTVPTLQLAIDAHLNQRSLESLPEYRRADQSLSPALDGNGSARPSFGQLYLNAPLANRALLAAGRSLPLPSDIQGLRANLQVTENGVGFESVAWTEAGEKPQGLGLAVPSPTIAPVPGGANSGLTIVPLPLGDRFPATTSLLWTGQSLRQVWQEFSQGKVNALNPTLNPEALRAEIKAITGSDLDRDWFNWMDGSYAVGLLPIPTRANSRFVAGLTLMIQTSDRRTAEQSLRRLDEVMLRKYRLQVTTGFLAGQSVTNWLSPQGEPIVTHGWLDSNIAFMVVGAPGAGLLLPTPQLPLAASNIYRDTMPIESQPNSTQPNSTQPNQPQGNQLFVDVDRVSKTNLLSLIPLPIGGQLALDALKSIGFRATPIVNPPGSGARQTRYDLQVQFLQQLTPSPLSPSPTISPSASPGSTPIVTPSPSLAPTPIVAPSPIVTSSPIVAPIPGDAPTPIASPSDSLPAPFAAPMQPAATARPTPGVYGPEFPTRSSVLPTYGPDVPSSLPSQKPSPSPSPTPSPETSPGIYGPTLPFYGPEAPKAR